MEHRNNAEFVRAVEHELSGVEFFNIGTAPGCPECPDDDEDCESFSKSRCESCGSMLGGTRHPAHGFIDGECYHFEVCSDCAMYHANADLPFDE